MIKMTNAKILNRKVKIMQDGKTILEFFEPITEDDKMYFSYEIGQVVESIAKLKKKPVTVLVTEEATIEPEKKED